MLARQHGLYSYGLYSHGLYSYGLHGSTPRAPFSATGAGMKLFTATGALPTQRDMHIIWNPEASRRDLVGCQFKIVATDV